ncbi:MAG TPA: hypothetical protein VNX70_18525 [Bryobacteraceae bacterium]|jgi:hypothetical protein|nr:hypothetical protein [Bryobacteraceae bacterium]
MSRLGIASCAMAMLALADGFTFTLGSPVAAEDFRAKVATFVFRTEGCADPAKAQIRGTAEGIVKGTRRSVALKVAAMSKPGVYAVYQTWPAEGEWVVNLKGTCAEANAGAIVPIGPRGFIRESAKFFPRPATDTEIETSLKALTQGGNK